MIQRFLLVLLIPLTVQRETSRLVTLDCLLYKCVGWKSQLRSSAILRGICSVMWRYYMDVDNVYHVILT